MSYKWHENDELMNPVTKRRLRFLISTAYFVVIALIAYLCFKYVFSWILPFVLAFLMVSALRPLINFLRRVFKVKHSVAAVFIMALLYIGLASLIGWLLFLLFRTFMGLMANIPGYFEEFIYPAVTRLMLVFSSFVDELPYSWQAQVMDIQQSAIKSMQDMVINMSQRGLTILTGVTNNVPVFLLTFIFTILLSFFISVQYEKVISFISNQIPPRVKPIIRDIRTTLSNSVFKYLRAYMIIVTVTFSELTLGFIIMGIPNAVVIAAGIAMFDLLPVFGTGTIVLPWAIIEILQGNYQLGIKLGILYGVVLLVRSIIEPKIVGDQLGINPIVSLMSIYFGFKLFGVFGMIGMPILMQCIIVLHENGKLKLYKKSGTE